jgi:outer membrane protein OmpA-like peptidoglycan-associated protein
MRPVSFIVSFASGSLKELTPEATVVFEQVKAELAMRPAPEITVIGHTDLVGNADANDKLSGIRAEVVKHLLVAAGLKADRIEAAGRGEREPLVPTAHGVAEARNRRVEINIR